MRLTIQRLRFGIVALAVGLITVIALFFVVARYERHRLAHDLPEKLGIHIQSSAQGVTYSQSDKKGRVLFTIHASKVVRFKGGGRATLQDVGITLFGKDGNRADRIQGSEFEYDPVAGFARANGDVELDLQGPDSGHSGGSSTAGNGPDRSTIHVKTSGLVFDKNTGIAHTDKAVEFRFPEASGRAIGATYDSSKGLLVLGSAVELSSILNGSPLTVRSSHAEFLRDSRQAFLLNVVADYAADQSISDQVIVYFREDGSADHLDAKGNIKLKGGEGRDITAQTASVQFDEKSQPRRANLAGGVLLHAEDAQHNLRGSAVEGTLELGDKGIIRHARMRTSVAIVDQQQGLAEDPNGSATRQLTTNQLDVDFATDEKGKSEPSRVLAAGNASIVLHTIHSSSPEQNTTLSADTLFANLAEGSALTSVEGKGHTQFTDLAADGTSRQSTGDTLLVKFDPQARKPQKESKSAARGKSQVGIPSQFGATVIQSALQQGNVRMTESPVKVDGKSEQHPSMVATANQALYTGSDQHLRMEGSPRITDGSLEMTALVFEVSRSAGDASATGDVKATYQQGSNGAPQVFGGQGPVHIVSDKATLARGSGDAVFRGQARLWQGTNSITAPVIELSRTQQTLKAYGEGGNARAAVSGAFLTPGGTDKQPGVVRLQGQHLLYSDAQRQANFSGSVVVIDDQATIRADEAIVVLAPVQAPGQKSGGLQAQVDHLVATGHVRLNQAERKGTGEKLIYTAQTGLFVLTGTAVNLPRLADSEHGTVSGDALIFNSRDDSVSVSGGKLGAVTETRVPR